MKLKIHWLFAAVILCGGKCNKSSPSAENPGDTTVNKTFVNPLMSGSDPWIVKHDSVYYYLHTLASRIAIWKTGKVSELQKTNSTTVFNPLPGKNNSHNIWAPELHRINNKWYIYYSAGAGPDSTQRTWVLENSNEDPTAGSWTDAGRIYNPAADFWSIDGTVLGYNGNYYFLWSGRPDINEQNQNIYISKMSGPTKLEGAVIKISQPEYPWETNGAVNEGPQVIKNNDGKIFVVYSASGCWTDDYCLGLLELKEGGDPLVLSDWIKSQQPVFVKQPSHNAYAPGHNAFFRSADGKEDWIIYHANTNSGDGCGPKRNIRMQKFVWDSTGRPAFGEPVKTGININVPSGE